MNIGEFWVKLGIDVDTPKVKDFADAIGNIPTKVATSILAIAGLEYSIQKLAQSAIETAIGFQMFESQTGLSSQELQKWQIVAEQANVSTEAIASSVIGLQRALAEIHLGRGNVSAFNLLGISPRETNAFQVLLQLRERIKGLDSATATNLISQMGISPEMIQVLKLEDAQFEKFTNHVRGMTSQQQESFLKTKLVFVEMAQTIKYYLFDFISHFTMALDKSEDFRKAMIGIGVVVAALAISFAPITAGIAALLLLLEDVAVYETGGKSLIGRIFGDKKSGGKSDGEQLRDIQSKEKESFKKLIHFDSWPAWLKPDNGEARSMVQTNHFAISSSSADAKDVAHEVHKVLKTATGQAEQQMNNQGY